MCRGPGVAVVGVLSGGQASQKRPRFALPCLAGEVGPTRRSRGSAGGPSRLAAVCGSSVAGGECLVMLPGVSKELSSVSHQLVDRGGHLVNLGLGLLCRTRPSWWVRRGLTSWVWLGVPACACGDRAVNNFLLTSCRVPQTRGHHRSSCSSTRSAHRPRRRRTWSRGGSSALARAPPSAPGAHVVSWRLSEAQD